MQALQGHVPSAVKHLTSTGRLANSTQLSLVIALPLRNAMALSNLLQQIYDPASPDYRHYLTRAEFTERFGPTARDYQAVVAFAKANHLVVTATHPNRLLLDVSGTAAAVEKALHVTLETYQDPTANREFYAPDREPALDLSVPVVHIGGLDNYALPRPHVHATRMVSGQSVLGNGGSGPSGAYMGSDFRAAYVPNTVLDGSGQVVGLLEFDGYLPSDIAYYEQAAKLRNVPLQNVLIDGFSGNPSGTGGQVEVSLDIDMAISMATNLSKVMVYETGQGGSWDDMLNRMADDNLARQLSCSWYIPGGTADAVADAIFQQMAAQGQSFFNASGDEDAYTGLISFPGDSPYITQVGGTTLTTSGPGGAWVSETVWNWGVEYGEDGVGSSGGISTQYGIPTWQTNITMASNGGSTTQRNTPDVAMTADNVYVRSDGMNMWVGGTSCAAPLWAGFAALVNQQATRTSQPEIGFINPALAAIGSGANYTTVFHDITTGNNTWSESPTQFYAVQGYDLCTGWGTPAGQSLIDALANPEPLAIQPASGFSAVGGVGGPFSVTSQEYCLTNLGTNTLTWSLSNTSSWLHVSGSGGTLRPGGAAAMVTISLNEVASNLVAGAYCATAWFTNVNDQSGQSREFSLSVIAPPSIVQQPTNQAVLEGAAALFSVQTAGGMPLVYQWQFNGTNLTDGAGLSGSATADLTISPVSAANVGIYTVVVTNFAGTVTSSNVALTIVPSAPVITSQPTNQTVYADVNVQFAVSVVGTSPYSYQWNFNGTNLTGATNATLTLADVQLDQSGDYSVLVSNLYGTTNSAAAVLTVNPPPPCDPVPSGIVAWWRAEDNGLDGVGGNNGTLMNGTTFTNGEVGTAFNLNGINNYVLANPSSLSSLDVGQGGGLTFEGWINPNTTSVQMPIIEYERVLGSWNGVDIGILIYINLPPGSGNGPGSIMADFADTEQAGHLITSVGGLIVPGVWQHIAVTYDKASGMAMIYLNGSVVTQSNLGTFTPQTSFTNLLLGARTFMGSPTAPSDKFSGGMDELSVYNRALSENEIAAIYQAGSEGKCFTPTPPAITAQPTNETVVVGAVAAFSVAASGTPPLNYQWNFNGTNLTGATNATLTLADVQLDQSGDYSVLVSNLYGTTNSAAAVLTVNPPPPCDPVPSGIVAWWRAEDNGLDGVGGNNGTLMNGTTFTNGEVGTAFNLNGINNYVLANPSSLSSLDVGQGGGLTFEGWINPNTTSVQMPIIEYERVLGSWNGVDIGILIYINLPPGSGNGPGSIMADFADTEQAGHLITSVGGLIVPGVWQHIAVTYDKASGMAMIYLNGSVVTQSNLGTFTPQTSFTNLLLGARTFMGSPTAPSDKFSGGMDELSVYNRALSENEIAAIYQAGSEGKCFTPTPPAITAQPTNETVVVGAVAAFSVAASGTPPLNYQWSFNGTNLVGATNATLTLTDVQSDQSGDYSVLVSNLYGATNSAAAVLTVYWLPPAIITQPSNQTVAVDGTATFSVVAVGTPPLSYQWSFNGTNLAGATNATLALTDVQLDQSGDYSVLVSNLYGATNSAEAVLTVYGIPPTIMTQPSSETVVVGGAASFSVAAVGTPPLGYQWNFNGTNLIGATNAMLTLSDVQLGQSGDYSVLVTNTFGSIKSAIAILTVNLPPSCDPAPAGLVAWWAAESNALDSVLGNNGTLKNGTTFTNGEVGMAFNLNGVNNYVLANPSSPSNLNVGLGTGLTFEGWINPNTTGVQMPIFEYERVLGSGNGADVGILFYINLPPSGGNGPGSIMANLVDVNQMPHSVVSEGNLVASGIWQHIALTYDKASGLAVLYLDGVNVFNATIGSFTPQTSFTNLLIGGRTFGGSAAAPSDKFSGLIDEISLYNRALSSNEIAAIYQAGSGGKCPLPPTIYSQPTNQTVNAKGTAKFTVGVVGTPMLKYQWSFNGTNLVTGTNATLTVTNVQLSNAGSYSVLVVNNYGFTNSAGAVLVVQAAPTITSQPTNQTVAAGGSATFCVTASGTSPLSYQWQFNGSNIGGATNSLLVLENVQFADGGYYSVQVTNRFGSVLSTYAGLTVQAPPVITTQPADQTIPVGGTAIFSSVATGSLPMSYQWVFDGPTNLTSGDNDTTLIIFAVQPANAGACALIVSNAFGVTISSNAILTVIDTLDHFNWSTIPSPRFVNAPFSVTIQAVDSVNQVFTNFTGTVSLTAVDGTAVVPSSSGNFVQGVWGGSLTIPQTDSNLVLEADDGTGQTGLANPFNVVMPPALSVARSGGMLFVFWPVEPGGFELNTTTNLVSPQWTPVGGVPIQIGNQYLETFQFDTNNQLYRLQYTLP